MAEQKPTPSVATLVRYARVRGTVAVASGVAAGGVAAHTLVNGGLTLDPGSPSFVKGCFVAGATVGAIRNGYMARRASRAATALSRGDSPDGLGR